MYLLFDEVESVALMHVLRDILCNEVIRIL
jgi:hypothetical protein